MMLLNVNWMQIEGKLKVNPCWTYLLWLKFYKLLIKILFCIERDNYSQNFKYYQNRTNKYCCSFFPINIHDSWYSISCYIHCYSKTKTLRETSDKDEKLFRIFCPTGVEERRKREPLDRLIRQYVIHWSLNNIDNMLKISHIFRRKSWNKEKHTNILHR